MTYFLPQNSIDSQPDWRVGTTNDATSDGNRMKTADQEQAEISALLKEAASAVESDLTTDAEIKAFLHRIDAAMIVADRHTKTAIEHSHDPRLDMVELEAVRGVATEMGWQSDRLRTMRRWLEAVARIAKERDKERELQAAYLAAQELRDRVAQRVRDEYPELARKLVDLAKAIAEADKVVSHVNAPGHVPKGYSPLNRVEGHAFGWEDCFPGNHPSEVEICRIAAVVLPDPEATARNAFAIWPPRSGFGNQSIPKPDMQHVLAAIAPPPVRLW